MNLNFGILLQQGADIYIEASQSKVSNQKGIVPIIALYIGVSVLPPASALSVELGVTLGKLIWGKK